MVSVLLERRNLLFMHVPRTGGGSISRALGAERDARAFPVRAMAFAEPCIVQLTKQLPKPVGSYRTVAFVRNPWDWTVSGYRHVTKNLPAYKHPPSFRQFVTGLWGGANILQYPAKFTTPEVYVAYHTQITPWEHIFAAEPHVEPDTICRFESIAMDAREKLGLQINLPHIHRTSRSRYSDYYDTETRAQVAKRHAPLIERFGYSFEQA
ncbi:MAG: sulfotransferase family 2 domain-containing protein [Pseudomonadota bacterium]